MARRQLIAGNWKMHLSRSEAVALASDIARGAGSAPAAEIVVCPPSPYLHSVCQAVQGSAVAVGGQNMWYESSGAYTGEISGEMLRDVGCRYVILGHSERRIVFGEDDGLIHRKVVAALRAELTPIVCVGERLEQREAGETPAVIRQQFEGSLAKLDESQIQRVIVAYEPVWAIGTGKVATADQAEQVHADLREMLGKRYNRQIAAMIRIQYGGSVKPENAKELLGQPNIDGALVGGASLTTNSFLAIVAASS